MAEINVKKIWGDEGWQLWVPPKRRIFVFRFSPKNGRRKTKNQFCSFFDNFWPILAKFWWFFKVLRSDSKKSSLIFFYISGIFYIQIQKNNSVPKKYRNSGFQNGEPCLYSPKNESYICYYNKK